MKSDQQEFLEESEQPEGGIVREFVAFLYSNSKWWLSPIIVILLLMGLLIVLGGTPLAPFIYSLF